MQTYPVKIFFHTNARLAFAVALFLVIGLHAVHFGHDHQKEIFGGGIQIILHGSDKKHFFVFDAPNFDISSAVFSAGLLISYFSIFFLLLLRKIFDPFREALRRGIIHPKIYS